MSKLLHIQFLRGLAALSVAFLHAQHDALSLAQRTGQTFEAFTRLPFMAGVDMFFVISGFIMVYASRPLFGKPESRGVFLARRIARIAPLYWTVTTLYLAVALAAPFVLNQPQPSGWMVIASYLFIPVMRPDGLVQPVYSLGWTLNYEMFFYVLFAAVIVLPIRSAMVSIAGASRGLALLGTFMRLPPTLAFWTDPIILEFAFGAGLGWLQSRGVTLSRSVRWALVVWGSGFSLPRVRDPAPVPLMRPLLWGMPVAMLVAAAALREDRTWAASLFTRFCAFLGDISYAIYLIHPFVIRGVEEVAVRSGLAAILGPVGFIMVALAGTVAAAFLFTGRSKDPRRRICGGGWNAPPSSRGLVCSARTSSVPSRPISPSGSSPRISAVELKSALVMNDREEQVARPGASRFRREPMPKGRRRSEPALGGRECGPSSPRDYGHAAPIRRQLGQSSPRMPANRSDRALAARRRHEADGG